MDRIEAMGAALVGAYLGWVVFTALRSGTVRYRGRVHARTHEPKTYWLTVGWFGLLAIIGLTFAVLRDREIF